VAAPAWKSQPVPDMVRRMFPGVESWAWVPPLRLRGGHEHVPGAACLVAVDEARTDALARPSARPRPRTRARSARPTPGCGWRS